MATKTKTGKKKKTTRRKSNERRIPKILGVMFGFLALYLVIAFISYIFTWKADQDQVLELSWNILLDSSVSVTNWLGRLGAVVSNLFFYWGFGIASFGLIPMLIRIGYSLIKKLSLLDSIEFFQKTFIGMCFVSVLSAFLFQHSSFPWGGSFGSNICYWLSNFVGQIGLTILLIFAVLAWLIWKFNPSMDMLVLATPQGNFNMPSLPKFNIGRATESRPSRKQRKNKQSAGADTDEENTSKTLRPRSVTTNRVGRQTKFTCTGTFERLEA